MFKHTQRVKIFMCLIFYTKTLNGEERAVDVQFKLNNTNKVVVNKTRRILSGYDATDTKPFMVYLRAAKSVEGQISDPKWLCGGAIVDSRYILTSAACIEDVKNFYVVSGTHRWSQEENECIKNGAKRAVWKCVPKDYYYDGNEFENIRWMINDIAIVKVEDDFNFNKRVKGCDFVPKKISYNNMSAELEKPGTLGSIAGWGSTDKYGDIVSRVGGNSPDLKETEVLLISKKSCKKRWDKRYHYIIDDCMICGKDGSDYDIQGPCTDQVNCKELIHISDDEDDTRRKQGEVGSLLVHGASHKDVGDGRRYQSVIEYGGFCENDHGGPLVVGHGSTATIVGIMAACLTTNVTKKCYGPFLYTSVYRNREVINCAINKEMGGQTCRRVLRSSKTRLNEITLKWP